MKALETFACKLCARSNRNAQVYVLRCHPFCMKKGMIESHHAGPSSIAVTEYTEALFEEFRDKLPDDHGEEVQTTPRCLPDAHQLSRMTHQDEE